MLGTSNVTAGKSKLLLRRVVFSSRFEEFFSESSNILTNIGLGDLPSVSLAPGEWCNPAPPALQPLCAGKEGGPDPTPLPARGRSNGRASGSPR